TTAPAARPTPVAAAAPAAQEHASAPMAAEPAVTGSFDGDWPALIARLPLTGFVRTWANKSEFRSLNAGTFELVVGHQKLADDKPMQEKLRAAIEQYLGKPVRMNVTVGEMAGASVAAITEKQNDERQRAAEASIMGDPFVKEMMEKVGTRPTNVRPV
ncbi:MAG: polymerase subunit gamma/tau, partial [Betaproteobacteria bacterium]|nr:polymerase subunit gamma/tau [Betaproteobacteria bacterium]